MKINIAILEALVVQAIWHLGSWSRRRCNRLLQVLEPSILLLRLQGLSS